MINIIQVEQNETMLNININDAYTLNDMITDYNTMVEENPEHQYLGFGYNLQSLIHFNEYVRIEDLFYRNLDL